MHHIPNWISRHAAPLLRVPLFWKLLLANAALVAVAGLMLGRPAGGGGAPFLLPLALTVLGVAVVNGLLVWLALRPVETLIRAARDVGDGRWATRVARSPLADRRLDRLRIVLNEMLDSISTAKARQRELSRRVLEVEERERERLASELYSGTAQTLAGVLIRLRLLARDVGDRPECESLGLITDEVRDALEEIRSTARRLRPPELDELGVRAALEAHARRLVEGTDLRVEFDGTLQRDDLTREGNLVLFRVIQEAIANAVRHADASRIRVYFRSASDGIVAEVEDDGRGFRSADSPPPQALGLDGMSERARHAGGGLSVDSEPGRGTRVRLVLPRRRFPDGPRHHPPPLVKSPRLPAAAL